MNKEARKRAIRKASIAASTGSIWVRRALDAGDIVRPKPAKGASPEPNQEATNE